MSLMNAPKNILHPSSSSRMKKKFLHIDELKHNEKIVIWQWKIKIFRFSWEGRGGEGGKWWRIMSENKILTLIQAELRKILIRLKEFLKGFV